MARGRRKHEGVTPRDRLVLDRLRRQPTPMSAYELIEALKGEGLSAPPSMYRVLARLMQKGLVHRLHALNAFVACAHQQHAGIPVFTICEQCRGVSETEVAALNEQLTQAATVLDFTMQHAAVEVLGRCPKCSQTTSGET